MLVPKRVAVIFTLAGALFLAYVLASSQIGRPSSSCAAPVAVGNLPPQADLGYFVKLRSKVAENLQVRWLVRAYELGDAQVLSPGWIYVTKTDPQSFSKLRCSRLVSLMEYNLPTLLDGT